jgi:hypothetical protein
MQLTAADRDIILDALFAYGMNWDVEHATKAQDLFLLLTDAKEFHFAEKQAAR